MDITGLLDCLPALVTRVFLVERGATERVERIVLRGVALVARGARLLRVGATLIMRLVPTLRAQVCLLVPGVQPLVNRTDFAFAIVGRAVGRMLLVSLGDLEGLRLEYCETVSYFADSIVD